MDYNSQAIEIGPHLLSLKVTKGALLYEKLQRQEAKLLLDQSLRETLDDYDRAVCHFYLALIERKRGHFPEAKKLAQRVRTFSQEKWLLLRLRQEFAI